MPALYSALLMSLFPLRQARLTERPELVADEVERRGDGDGDRLRGHFAHRPALQEDLQHHKVDAKSGEADEEEAGSLEYRPASTGGEGPVAIPEEVVGDGHRERPDRREPMRDIQPFGERREDREIDQVARAADESELGQLDPGGSPPNGRTESEGDFGGGDQASSVACSDPPKAISAVSRTGRRRRLGS